MAGNIAMISVELAQAVLGKATEQGVARAAGFTEVPVTKTDLKRLSNDCRVAGERLVAKGVSDEARSKGLRCAAYAKIFEQLAEGNEGYARKTLEI